MKYLIQYFKSLNNMNDLYRSNNTKREEILISITEFFSRFEIGNYIRFSAMYLIGIDKIEKITQTSDTIRKLSLINGIDSKNIDSIITLIDKTIDKELHNQKDIQENIIQDTHELITLLERIVIDYEVDLSNYCPFRTSTNHDNRFDYELWKKIIRKERIKGLDL